MFILLIVALFTPASPTACFKYGSVVTSNVPRITDTAGEFCAVHDADAQPVKDGVFRQNWDVRRSPRRRWVRGRFRRGVPDGVWIIGLHRQEVWIDFSDGSTGSRAAIRPLNAGAVPPILTTTFEEAKPHGQWAYLPGTPQAHLGTVSQGRLHEEWTDGFRNVIGTYRRGRLVRGQPVPRAVRDGLKLIAEQLAFVHSLARFSPAERKAIREQESRVEPATP